MTTRRHVLVSYLLLLAAAGLFSFDAFQATVLLPTLVPFLGGGAQVASFIIAAYFAVLSGFLAAFGLVGDRIGEKAQERSRRGRPRSITDEMVREVARLVEKGKSQGEITIAMRQIYGDWPDGRGADIVRRHLKS